MRAPLHVLHAAIALGFAGLVAAGASPRPEDPRGATAPTPEVRPVVLPRDHGVHPGFQVEWWYGAGVVHSRHDDAFSWFATIWSSGPGAVARVNVVDLEHDRVVLAREYLVTGALQRTRLLDVVVDGLRLRWRPRGAFGRFSLSAATGDGALTLSLVPRRRYIRHGRRGVIEMGGGGPSAYYSSTRLRAKGVLRAGDRRIPVRGEGWLDHQWGNFAGDPEALRWDWFGCRFKDGRDLMLFRFLDLENRPRPGYDGGTLVGRNGRIRRITDFCAVELEPFLHPAGATATYPLGWRLKVPGAGLDFTLQTLARNQFIRNQFVPSFWEGAATVIRGPRGLCFVEDSREPLPARPPLSRFSAGAALRR
jgi:predicted secreted hydrolase